VDPEVEWFVILILYLLGNMKEADMKILRCRDIVVRIKMAVRISEEVF
jgi:hypothetical protein